MLGENIIIGLIYSNVCYNCLCVTGLSSPLNKCGAAAVVVCFSILNAIVEIRLGLRRCRRERHRTVTTIHS
jgi:hypothetical protein